MNNVTGDLLLELLCQDIPALMQKRAIQEIEVSVINELKKNEIEFSKIRSYITHRRIVIIIDAIPLVIKGKQEEVKGPGTKAPEKAIQAFLKKHNCAQEDLKIKDNGKYEFYSLSIESKDTCTNDILIQIITDSVFTYVWPKSMLLEDLGIKWVRPINNIMCIFANKVLALKIGTMKANNKSTGHRFKHHRNFAVISANDYLEKLSSRGVILDQSFRKEAIESSVQDILTEENLEIYSQNKLFNYEHLIQEINGSSESPKLVLCKLEEELPPIPTEILLTILAKKQKYIPLQTKDGKLSNFFIVPLANYSESNLDIITASHERIFRIQLNAALHLCEEDLKKSLDHYLEKLKYITFHDRLGSMHQKSTRITALSKYLSMWVKDAHVLDVEKAAMLTKIGLATFMGQEYPHSQGIIAAYYTEKEGMHSQEVITAIAQHLMPIDAYDATPDSPAAIAISIADKMDNIVGFFISGNQPSGSKDPFGLRRAALGIIRNIINNQLFMPINVLITKSMALYTNSLHKKESVIKKIFLRKKDSHEDYRIKSVTEEVLLFIQERLRALLLSYNIRYDIVNSLTKFTHKNQDILVITKKAAVVSHVLEKNHDNITAPYKRAANILQKSDLAPLQKIRIKINYKLLQDKHELDLYNELTTRKEIIKQYLRDLDFKNATISLIPIGTKINLFLDNVMVNCDNMELRTNRIRILAKCCNLFNKILDFNEIKE